MFYVERQVSKHCRKHALNAFFKKEMFTWETLEGLSRQFETKYHLPSTDRLRHDVDYFNADGSSLLTFACDAVDPSCFYLVVPKNQLSMLPDAFVQDRLMVFNDRHVWAAIQNGTAWVQLDSLRPTPQHTLRPYDARLVHGIVLRLCPPTALAYASMLKKNIDAATNGTVDGIVKLIGDQLIGDVHPHLENWVYTRLRILAWVRGPHSRSQRVFSHAIDMGPLANKKLIVYAAVMS